MTKTNSLKKALAGILAACMAATTLVAAPFTIGNSRNVGAASLDDMELLAQYSFESGYTDSVSGESGTPSTSGVTLEEGENGSYAVIADNVGVSDPKNYIRFNNPLKDENVDLSNGFTIAMKVKNTGVVNAWEGLWGFMNNERDPVDPPTTYGFYGLSNNGGFHYNDMNGHTVDLTNQADIGISQEEMSEVVCAIDSTGTMNVYVDGALKLTVTGTQAPECLDFITSQDYFYIGVSTSCQPWNTGGGEFDDVRIYSGAADAIAASQIYAVGSWDFENGVDGLNVVGKAAAYVDETQGNVLNIPGDYTNFEKSYVRLDNPLYQAENIESATISMDMYLTTDGTTANMYEGHWRFTNGTTDQDGFFGMVANGGLRFNECFDVDENLNRYFDSYDNSVLSVDGAWHKVTVVVKNDGTINTYVDDTLKNTVTSANMSFDPAGSATATGTEVLNWITSSQYLDIGIGTTFWGSAGAYYDNVAVYDKDVYANVETPEEPEEPEEPVDPGDPIPISRDAIYLANGTITESQWQVIDGDESQTSKVSVEGQAEGSNYSVYGWFKLNTATSPKGWMNLYQQTSVGNDWAGSRMWVQSDGQIGLRVENSGYVDTYLDYGVTADQPFFLTVNYDGANKVVDVYVNGQLVASQSGHAVPASNLPVSAVWLGISPLTDADAILDGSVAGFYYWNSLFNPDDIASYMNQHPAPTSDLPRLEYATAPIENLNIIEGQENVTYGTAVDENGNKEITKVNGNAKAQLSTEKYTQETLAATADARYTGTPGYRAYDVEAFLGNADDFTVTSWVRWYGDGSTAWGGTQTLQAQRFFDLFNIDEADQSKYEFYFNGWEENYYQRNPSVSSTSEIQEAVDELGLLNNNPNVASSESGVYLCGITAGATLNGLNRPCFRPGKTFVSNGNQTSSGLPYQWAHIAVVYDANGHVGSDGTVYGASLTYYVDGAAYATRYFDYSDFDTSANEFYQNNSSPKDAYYIDGQADHTRPANADNEIVGGSVDGADIIYGLQDAEALKVKNMALDTLYLGGSSASTALWNGQYENAYLYNYALTSNEVGEDYVDLVKPLEGASMEVPTEANNISTTGRTYALITESTNVSKTMELGFNAEWITSAYRGTSSLSFNGDGGYAEVDTSLLTTDGQPIKADGSNVSDKLTFSTWVNLNDTVLWGRIFDIKGENGELFLSNNGYFNNDTNIGLGLRSSTLVNGIQTAISDVSVGTSINTGTWVNVTVVIDGTDVALYFQGELETTGKLTMPLSQMGINNFFLSRSAAVDGKYGLPLDQDNNMVLDETYLLQEALSEENVLKLAQYGYAGAPVSTVEENSTRLEMLDVQPLFNADANVNVYYVDINDHKTLSADVMNALANSTGKTLYVRVQQGVSYDFIWKLTSEAFAGRSFTAADEFDLLVSGANMSNSDATTILTKWSQKDPSANVTLQAQTITVYADKLPVELPLFINYNREFLETVDNGDGTQSLKDVSLNLYKGSASSYSLVTAGLPAATDLEGNTLKQNYTNPTSGATGNVIEYYVQNLTEGGSYILTPNELP